MPESEVLRLLGEIELAFEKTWLESHHPGHRIKSVWQRTDALATTELVTLGDAISIFRERDPHWLSQRVRDIKRNTNNCHGYIFELLASAMIARTGLKIYPTHKNAPGIDAILQFDDGFEINLSFKNHDASSHEREFISLCSKARARVRSKLRKFTNTVIVFIDSHSYLTNASWDAINRHIDAMPAGGAQPLCTTDLPDNGYIMTGDLMPSSEIARLSKSHLSDTFFALCGWQRNEQENIKSKLSAALSNLARHTKRSGNSANFVMLRLNKTADLELMAEHAREILDESLDSTIDGIIFYQASVTRASDVSQVSHHMKLILRRNFTDRAHVIPFAVLVGVVSPQASRLELRSATGETYQIRERYIFQEGDHYYATPPIEQNPTFILSSVAPGVRTHAVLGGSSGEITLSGIFPPTDDLVLL